MQRKVPLRFGARSHNPARTAGQECEKVFLLGGRQLWVMMSSTDAPWEIHIYLPNKDFPRESFSAWRVSIEGLSDHGIRRAPFLRSPVEQGKQMRFSLILGLLLASLVVTAAAQKHQKPKAKPSYSEEKDAKAPSRTVKPPSNKSSSAQELHRLEQSSSKTSGARRGTSNKAPRTGAVLKAEKQERNPPIQFSSSGGGTHGGKGKAGSNEYKGRLRHKGSHR